MILITRRAPAEKLARNWEFPSRKVENNESLKNVLFENWMKNYPCMWKHQPSWHIRFIIMIMENLRS